VQRKGKTLDCKNARLLGATVQRGGRETKGAAGINSPLGPILLVQRICQGQHETQRQPVSMCKALSSMEIYFRVTSCFRCHPHLSTQDHNSTKRTGALVFIQKIALKNVIDLASEL